MVYDRFELRIFVDKYELWDTAGPPYVIDSALATTAGRRNIGIRAGLNAGVWVDGSQLLGGPTTILPRPQVRFGTHNLGETNQPGLILLENLCYVRSWLRHASQEESIPTGPRVTTTFFDGPRPVTVREPVDAETSPAVVNFTEDGTRADHTNHNDTIDTLTLPNGRRTTGQVIRPYADGISYEGGTPIELEEAAPGVAIRIAVDAVGATQNQVHLDPWELKNWPNFGYATTSSDFGALYGISDIAIYHGPGGGAESDKPTTITSLNNAPGTSNEAITTGAFFNVDTGTCACRDLNASVPTTPVGTTEAATGGEFDYVAGNMTDTTTGVIYSGGYDDELPIEVFGATDGEGNEARGSGRSRQIVDTGRGITGRSGTVHGEHDPRRCGSGGAISDDVIDGAIFVLDILGFVPGVGAIADGLGVVLELSKEEVDYLAVALTGLSAAMSVILPVVGDSVAVGAKWAWKAGKKINVGALGKVVGEALAKAKDAACDLVKKAADEILDWWKKIEDWITKHVPADRIEGDFALAGAGGPNIAGATVLHQTGITGKAADTAKNAPIKGAKVDIPMRDQTGKKGSSQCAGFVALGFSMVV